MDSDEVPAAPHRIHVAVWAYKTNEKVKGPALQVRGTGLQVWKSKVRDGVKSKAARRSDCGIHVAGWSVSVTLLFHAFSGG